MRKTREWEEGREEVRKAPRPQMAKFGWGAVHCRAVKKIQPYSAHSRQ